MRENPQAVAPSYLIAGYGSCGSTRTASVADDDTIRLALGFAMLAHPSSCLVCELVTAIGIRYELVHGCASRSHKHHIARFGAPPAAFTALAMTVDLSAGSMTVNGICGRWP